MSSLSDIFLIFRQAKPITDSENKIELIGQTVNEAKATLIANRANPSELKKVSDQGNVVNGNRAITEVYSKEEWKDATAEAMKEALERLKGNVGDIPL